MGNKGKVNTSLSMHVLCLQYTVDAHGKKRKKIEDINVTKRGICYNDGESGIVERLVSDYEKVLMAYAWSY